MAYETPATNLTPGPIDVWVEDGFYRNWADTVAEIRKQYDTLESTLRLLPASWAVQLTMQTKADAFLLEKIAYDLGSGLQQVTQGKPIEAEQLQQLATMQSGMLETLKLEVGCLQAVVAAGMLASFILGQFSNVQRAAVDAQSKIADLKVALNTAKNQRLEAVGQGVLDAGVFIATLAFPELAVLTKISLSVGQWVGDEYLGGSKGSAALDKASDVASPSGVVLSSADPKWIGTRLGKAGSKAGTALGIVGLGLDGAEISTQFKNVDAVSTALNAAVASLSTVRKLLVRLYPGLLTLRGQMNAVARTIREDMESAATFRDDVRDDFGPNKYSPGNPIVWRMEKK